MINERIRLITTTGLFTALIFVATWAFHVPIGTNGGYIHFADALIYIAATILPLPSAMVAAAVGAGLSDFLSPGGAVWILPTMLIKPLCCLPFTRKKSKFLCVRNIIGVFIAGAITTIGYFIATIVIAGSVAVAATEIFSSLIQATGSGICFIALCVAFDKTNFKKYVPFILESRS